MSLDIKLSIAEEFGEFPAGRVPDDGAFNGETFRKKYLVPKLREAQKTGAKLKILLNGLKACGSSFIDEAFGGLERYESFSKRELMKLISVESDEKHLQRYKIAIDRKIGNAKVG